MKNKIASDIYFKVKNYIEKQQMIISGDTVLAGVSGGADSVCLLVILSQLSKELKFDLIVVHVHHGVREDADADAEYVKELCDRLGHPFFFKKVDMTGYAQKMGLSCEEAGRRLRYEAFEEILSDEAGKVSLDNSGPCRYKIAVAHNKNDRAETFLFNLFRGSGLKGLGSIQPVRGNIIHPLLCLDRVEIEDFLNKRNIAFCIDSTNEEDNYTRNKIRHNILAYANEQICSNATKHICYAADILSQTEDFIQRQTALAYERCVVIQTKSNALNDGGVCCGLRLDLKVFKKEEPFLQHMIMLKCMETLTPHRKDITKEHIEALVDISNKDGSMEISLPYGLTAYKEYDTLVIFENTVKVKNQKREAGAENAAKSDEFPYLTVTVPGEFTVKGLGVLEFRYYHKDEFFYKNEQIIPEKTYTKWFDCDKITKALVLRTRESGDYLTIDSALRKKSVKEYMINEKIPKVQRNCIYLLADGPHILWIPGYRISQYYKVDKNTKHILQVRLKENDNG